MLYLYSKKEIYKTINICYMAKAHKVSCKKLNALCNGLEGVVEYHEAAIKIQAETWQEYPEWNAYFPRS